MEKSTRPRRITPAEWETHKAEILELFPTLEKKDLLEHLKKKHGFCPTPNQYERQKKKWDMMKNITTEDWEYIRKAVEKRKRLKKKSQVIAHGRVIKHEQLRRGIKRIYANPGTAPEGIVVSTPLPETSASIDDSLNSAFTRVTSLLEQSEVEQCCSEGLAQCTFPRSGGGGSTEANNVLLPSEPFGQTMNTQAYSSDDLLLGGSVFNDDSAFRQSPEQEKCIVEGKRLLGKLVNETCHPDSATYADRMNQLLWNLTMGENHNYHMHQFCHGSYRQQLFQILHYIIYLWSNNLVTRDQTDDILCWILESDIFWFFEAYLALPNPEAAFVATTLLHAAVRLGELKTIRTILEKKTSKCLQQNLIANYPASVGKEAVRAGNLTVVRTLIEFGLKVPSRDWARLFLRKKEELGLEKYRQNVQFVIDQGVDLNDGTCAYLRDYVYVDPKGGISVGRKREICVRIVGDTSHQTLFDDVIESGDVEAVRICLRAGAQVNKIPVCSATPLQVAAGYGNVEVVKLLIEAGANIDAPIGIAIEDFDQSLRHPESRRYCTLLTPLQIAMQRGEAAVAEILLENGANVNGFDTTSFCDEWQRIILDYDELQHQEEFGRDQLASFKFWNDAAGEQSNECPRLNLVKTPLQEAAARGDLTLVSRLLELGANLHTNGGIGTALQIAAAGKGNLELVKRLVGAGADVNAPAYGVSGRTALQAAIQFGDGDTIHFLLESGANVDAFHCRAGGRTALQAAVERNDIILANYLIMLDANVNAKASDIGGRPCLQAASSIGSLEMVKLLLKNGGKPNATYSEVAGGIAALQAAVEGKHLGVACELLNHGANLHERHADYGREYYYFPLWASVATRQEEMTQMLLDRGADPDFDSHKTPLLSLAIDMDDTKTAELLIEYGADVKQRDDYSNTPLEYAAANNSLSLCRLLVAKGAKVEGNRGTSALHAAITEHNVEIVRFLLSQGVSPNWEKKPKCRKFRSSIARACVSSDSKSEDKAVIQHKEAILEMLLSHGVHVDPEEYFGYQVCNLSLKMIQRLIKAGLNTNAVESMEETMLCYASRKGMFDVVQLLLTAGADPNIRGNGYTALQGAVKGQHLSVIQLLLSNGADVNKSRSYEPLKQAFRRMYGLESSNDAEINPSRTSQQATTALHQAIAIGSKSLVVLLLEAGAEVDVKGTEEGTSSALSMAAMNGRLDIARLLVKKDKELNTLHIRCRNAAEEARACDFPALATELQRWGGGNILI
ncbi:hypothetical protein NLG97_g767 [Lecanicillium saksenae]|uniref:Uncharacterized protein n=1 Tax=Lecanicillium saksenae TaxID=468837 RepID=A0ACC1R948_9HYPO|nr:hypothetical protein NLG97_g767 [Lecanicillium saksenae]